MPRSEYNPCGQNGTTHRHVIPSERSEPRNLPELQILSCCDFCSNVVDFSTPLFPEWYVGRWFCLPWKFSPCTSPEIFIIRYYFLHRFYIHAMLSPVQSIKLKFDWIHTSKCLKPPWENLPKQCNFCAHCHNFRQNLVLKENFRVDRLTFLWFIDKI